MSGPHNSYCSSSGPEIASNLLQQLLSGAELLAVALQAVVQVPDLLPLHLHLVCEDADLQTIIDVTLKQKFLDDSGVFQNLTTDSKRSIGFLTKLK